MNRSIKTMVSLLLRGAGPAAAITLGASPQPVLSAPGDLDPGFGDFGRVGPIVDFAGPAWSAHLLGSGETFIAGGDSVCDYDCAYYHSAPLLTSFAGDLSDAGTVDSGFAFSPLKDTEVLDTALLPDGSIIAVGQTTVSKLPVLTVFKLSSSGALDTSFGKDGVFRLASLSHKGTSVTVDKDGRIVVAGPQKTPAALIVVRLHPNGVIDDSFGTSGVFIGPASDFLDSAIHVIGTGSGYRVT